MTIFAKTEKVNPKIAELLKEYKVTDPKQIERPYGWKIELDSETSIVCLKRGMEETPDLKLDPHPRTLWQHVEVLGLLHPDGKADDTKYLLFITDTGKKEFGTGGVFYSVMNDAARTGNLHIMLNTRKDDDIILLVKNKNLPVEIRTESSA